MWDGPLFDNHMHIDPLHGRGLEAVRDFTAAGGTHLVLVGKTARDWGIDAATSADFFAAYEHTIDLAKKICRETDATAYPAVGYHPAEFAGIAAVHGVTRAIELGIELLEVWERLYAERRIIAVGEVGRPHYPVDTDIWDGANLLLAEFLRFSRKTGCPLQLHTEHFGHEQFEELGGMIRTAGSPDKIIKHFCPPVPDEAKANGMIASIVASKDAIVRALGASVPFFMETDYIDDMSRPGAVLGPKTVPKRTKALHDAGVMSHEACWGTHVDLPERVYGITMHQGQ